MCHFAAEKATNHWDGSCLIRNKDKNNYIAYNGSTHFYVPSGVDQTFQCPFSRVYYPPFTGHDSVVGGPYCKPIVECNDDHTCHEPYEEAQARVDEATTRRTYCPDWGRTVAIAVVLQPALTLATLLLKRCTKDYKRQTRPRRAKTTFTMGGPSATRLS